MQDIPFNASYSPVFRPDTVGSRPRSSDQQLSISAGSSARKAHFRRLYDIWQLSVQRGDTQQARRAYSLLVRFSEFEWATNWRTGIAMVSVDNGDDGDALVDAQMRYLRECHAVHSRPATARGATREPIAVLLQLVLLLIHHHRYQQALNELELYLNTYPYRDDAGLHEYAGMLALSLAQDEAAASQISHHNNNAMSKSSNNNISRKRRHSSNAASSSSSTSSSSSSSSDNENSAPSTSKTGRQRSSKGKYRASQPQNSEDAPPFPLQTLQRPSVKTVQQLVQDAPTMIMDARRYFERAIEISTMAMDDDIDGTPGLESAGRQHPSELAGMWLDLLNGREPTEKIIHQAPPTPKATKSKDTRKRKTRSVSAAASTVSDAPLHNASSSFNHLQNDEDDQEDDDENDITISNNTSSRSRPTFGSLERQFENRHADQAMLSS